ncbi:uncharacterized protein LOC124935375 [Impatiens glandulifera]|uniref:uncharacterized protein LOC124935375 n=1 Tax=Impatiens glandulifera TaxID=253017 RepID=UPI001FB0C46D|nr:uncharacterized protein LOC124935375 [Impatiens glandulifera]
MEEETIQKKRFRTDSDELDLDSPEVKRLRDDLLNDSDPSTTTPEDLDSFMKTFQQEISASPPPPPQTDLGYLLEASDDELGLPPSTSLTPVREQEKEQPERIELFSELWKLDDEFLSYDSFDFGIGQEDDNNYVALDGLFDYSDFAVGSSSSDAAELLVRPETLPAQ